MPRQALLLVLVTAASAPGLAAQQYPLLEPALTRWITQEVSGDAAYEHVRFMTQFHRPGGGSDGLLKVAQHYEAAARELGLSEVELLMQPYDERPWNAKFADLWLMGDAPERLASTLQTAVHLADYSRPVDVTTELVDVGEGREEDLARLDVKGKVVLTYGSLGGVMKAAVCARGAAGVIWYPSPFTTGNGIDGGGSARPDQIRWISIPSEDEADCKPTFAFGLSLNQGLALRAKLAGAKQPLTVHAHVESAFTSAAGDQPWQVMVTARLPGTDPTLPAVVYSGHLQEEATSANDDATGCAGTFEVARTLKTLIDSGRIPRPRRSLVFWWVTEISSQRQLFADRPELVKTLWLNINQDMSGCEQSLDLMRKQNVTRLPATRFHALNDVMEAAVEYMVAANNFELSQLLNGIPLYPAPVLAHRGTKHRWNAEAIFFHNNTDHMTFLEAPIGRPGITFTNMPDRYIHSSDDDLWNVDATQLGRSVATAALIGYTLARADTANVAPIVAEVAGRGAERQARNLRLARALVGEPGGEERALEQVRFALERERLALASLAELGAGAQVKALVQAAEERAEQALAELGKPVARAPASEAATRLATLKPSLVGGPKEWQARNSIGGVPGLHSLMAFEVLCAIDGRRSGLEIARFVAAEAREAGAHYFGTVEDAAVLAYLENAARAGLVRLQ